MTDYDDFGLTRLMFLLNERHNAMLADQAAEAIWDFEFALSLLCLEQPTFDEFGGVLRMSGTIDALLRGLR